MSEETGINIYDNRRVTVYLDGLPEIPESMLVKESQHKDGKHGLFKPELLHIEWRRGNEEHWELYWLYVEGKRYLGNGKLGDQPGMREYTHMGKDDISLIDATWIPPLIKHLHPVIGFGLD